MADLISVIVTTYEREDALDAVLRSLSRQSDRGFEVVVADDGSGPGTKALVERWKPQLGVPLSYVWHEHQDFRAGEIRNRAILASKGRYCVFLDGDCLARTDFIATHRGLAEPGWFVTGNRALLSPSLTERTLREYLEPERWMLGAWLGQRFNGGLNRLASVLRLPLGPLRKLRPQQWEGARSCNLAVWRADLDRVDGFDQAFSGWARRIPICWCASSMLAFVARMVPLRPRFCIFGIRRPIARVCRSTRRSWPRWFEAATCAPSAVCPHWPQRHMRSQESGRKPWLWRHP